MDVKIKAPGELKLNDSPEPYLLWTPVVVEKKAVEPLSKRPVSNFCKMAVLQSNVI